MIEGQQGWSERLARRGLLCLRAPQSSNEAALRRDASVKAAFSRELPSLPGNPQVTDERFLDGVPRCSQVITFRHITAATPGTRASLDNRASSRRPEKWS